MLLGAHALQGLASGTAVAMGVEPAAHPDVAVFGVPDLGQLHNTATAGPFEWVVAEGGGRLLGGGSFLEDGHFDLRATTYYAEKTCRAPGRVPLEDEAFVESWKTCWRTGTQPPDYKIRDYTPLIERGFRYLAF
jgi:hypothetical protein